MTTIIITLITLIATLWLFSSNSFIKYMALATPSILFMINSEYMYAVICFIITTYITFLRIKEKQTATINIKTIINRILASSPVIVIIVFALITKSTSFININTTDNMNITILITILIVCLVAFFSIGAGIKRTKGDKTING